MKTLKKLFSVSAIVALLGTLAPMYAFGAGKYSDELEEAYAYAYKHEITTMSSIDNANMYGDLDRIAMAKMLANYAIDVLGLTPDTTKACTFPDVSASLDEEYDNGVTKACQLGLMGVGITNFNPRGKVTRAEFGTAFSRALNNGSDKLEEMNAANPYYKEHLKYLNTTVSSNGKAIMTDISNPSMKEVRGYVMIMMMRADGSYTPSETCTLEERVACLLGDNAEACLAACQGEEPAEEEDLPGYATVSTKAAADQNVALNAVDKKIGTVTLKAGENDTTVTALEITKSGLGDKNDILNIQLMKNGEYISNQATLNGNNVAKLRFRPNVVLKANKSETFDVVVSMNGAAAQPGGTHDFAVTAVTVSNGTFGGTPARLGSLTTTNYTIKGTTVDLDGSNVNAGDNDVTIIAVKINTPVNANIASFTLTSEGNQDGLYNVFSNVKAYVDNKEVGKVTINEETIVVEGLNQDVEKNDDLDVVLRGDVIYVGNEDYFDLTLKNNHVVATESNTNERMPSATAGGGTNPARVNITNKVGLTLKNLTKDSQTVAVKSKDVELLNLELSAAANLDVKSYYVDFGSAITNADLENIVLSIDGNETDIDPDDMVGSKIILDDSIADTFSVVANNTVKIKVKADTIKAGNYTLIFGIVTVKNTDTNTTVDTEAPATELLKQAGHNTVIKGKGSITVVKGTSAEGTTIKGGEATDILVFNIKAKSEAVTLNQVDFTLDTVNLTRNDIDKVELYQGNTKLASLDGDKLTAGADPAGQFKNLSKDIKVDEGLDFSIRLTLATTAVANLGETVQAIIAADEITAKGKTSKATITNASPINGKPYQLSTAKAALEVSQNGKYINVTVNNNSAYDMVLRDFQVAVEGEMIDGENMIDKVGITALDLLKNNTEGDSLKPGMVLTNFDETKIPGTLIALFKASNKTANASCTAGAGAWDDDTELQEHKADCLATVKTAAKGTCDLDGNPATAGDSTADVTEAACIATVGYEAGTSTWTKTADAVMGEYTAATVTPATYPVISSSDSMTFVIEMTAPATIKDTYYNAIAKQLNFYYVEDYNEGGTLPVGINLITEKFNENN